MSDAQPPIDYLVDCSKISLESFELSRLNRASNLRKELSQVVEEWIQAEASSRLARWIGERRLADVASPHSMGPQRTGFSLLDQSALPFSSDPPPDAEGREIVLAQSKPMRKRSVHPKVRSAFVRSVAKDKALGTAGVLRATPATSLCRLAKTFANPFRIPRQIETLHRPNQSLSAQALMELKALDEVASGPPEIHRDVMQDHSLDLCAHRFR